MLVIYKTLSYLAKNPAKKIIVEVYQRTDSRFLIG